MNWFKETKTLKKTKTGTLKTALTVSVFYWKDENIKTNGQTKTENEYSMCWGDNQNPQIWHTEIKEKYQILDKIICMIPSML